LSMLAITLILLVALLRLYFLVLEMFLWTRPAGLKVFRNTPEKAELTRVLAANQGLYNGFLAAGLAWAVLSSQRDVALLDRKSTRLNSSHQCASRMPSSA